MQRQALFTDDGSPECSKGHKISFRWSCHCPSVLIFFPGLTSNGFSRFSESFDEILDSRRWNSQIHRVSRNAFKRTICPTSLRPCLWTTEPFEDAGMRHCHRMWLFSLSCLLTVHCITVWATNNSFLTNVIKTQAVSSWLWRPEQALSYLVPSKAPQTLSLRFGLSVLRAAYGIKLSLLFCGVLSFLCLRNTSSEWYSDDVSRLGESAAGDGLSGHFPVSCVESVSGPPLRPPLPHQHLDVQMADCSHHAGSCK